MSDEETIDRFTSDHQFRIRKAMADDQRAILWLLGVKDAVAEELVTRGESLASGEVSTWRLLEHMLDRVYEHAAAAVVCFFTGSWAAMEVVVRAAIEAAVTNVYITMEDKEERLGQYFGHYFRVTRERLERSKPSRSVQDALEKLKQREKWFREIAALDGIKFHDHGWPERVLDRFQKGGMEEAYHTIYGVLSSQAHGDADATVDYVLTQCVRFPGFDHERAATIELVFWIRLYLYYCIRFYAVAALSYARAFGLDRAFGRTLVLKEEIERHIESLGVAFHGECRELGADAEKRRDSSGGRA